MRKSTPFSNFIPTKLTRILFASLLFLLATSVSKAQGDNCDQALALTNTTNFCSSNAQYTNVGSTASGYSAAPCWTNSPLEDVWFSFVCTGTDVLISINGSSITRPRIALYTGVCGGTLNQAGGSACTNGTAGSPDAQLYVGGLVQGTTYLIRVSTTQAQEGTFQLCINNYTPPASASADCGGAGKLCNKNPISVSGLNGGGSNNNEVSGTCMGGFLMYETNSVWYTWTCATAGTLTFDLLPANQIDDIDFAVFQLSSSDPCGPRTLLRCTAASCANSLASTGMNMTSTDVSELPGCTFSEDAYVQYINMTAGTSYALLINNASASTGFTLNWGGTGTFVGPDANITGAPFTACAGNPVTLNGTTSTNYSSLNWNFNNGSGSASTTTGPGPVTVTYNTPGTYTAILNATGSTGCTSVETAQVTINPSVTPTFTPLSSLCQNATPPVLPTTSNNGITGTWSPAVSTATVGTTTYTFAPSAGQCAATTTLNLTITPAATITFASVAAFCQGSPAPAFPSQTQTPVVTGTWSPSSISNTSSGTYTFTPNAGQCASPATISVTVVPSVTPAFTAIPALCLNQTAPLLPNTSNNGVSGTWSPATINTSSSGSTNYTFTPNAGSCATPVTITVVVGSAPTPTFTQIPAICQGTTAPTFPTTSLEGIDGSWSPGLIDNTANGTYTFTPNSGLCATTATMNITVTPLVNPTFTAISAFCQGTVAPVLPGTSTNSVSGTWSPSVVSNTSSGTYNFTPNANQCANTVSMSIVVNPLPVVNASGNSPVCSGDAIQLSGNTLTGATYSWSGPASFTSTLEDPVISPAAIANSGTYALQITDANGCVNQSTTNVVVSSATAPVLTPAGPFCEEDATPVQLNADTPNGTWSGTGITDPNGEFSPAIAGIGTHTLTYTLAQGCGGSQTMDVTVVATPGSSFQADITAGCSPLTVNFTSDPGMTTSFWDFGTGGNPQNGVGGITHTFVDPGVYTITLSNTLGGCSSTTTLTSYILVVPDPDAEFNVNNNILSQLNTTVQFQNSSLNGISYLWNFGDGSPQSNVENPTHTYPAAPGSYTATLTVVSAGGCIDVTTLTIIIEEDQTIYVPNAFTPDGDEYNNVFIPYLTEGFDPENYSLTIFDRWGEILFESHDVSKGWDGTYHDHVTQQGTYTWTIKVKNKSTDKYSTYTGHLTLLR